MANKIIARGQVSILSVNDGTDSNLLDWVNEWNNGKTLIGSESVITPKLFAGVKNSNGTITGIALGKFALSTVNTSGNITTENINGIYGFKDGYKTFSIDNSGNVQLGNNNQFIRYNSVSGKVEFGSDVALAWENRLTYIDVNGIFTGTLSANTVNAIKLNASQIITGTIDAARINVESIKASLITAININALTLDVVRGTIGSWSIDSDSIFKGIKNNTSAAYTSASGAITMGSNGIRGFKWRLDSIGSGALAGGNISWDAAGNVVFGSGVSLNWTNAANDALNLAKAYTNTVTNEVKQIGVDAKGVADAITKKSNDEKWGTKLTYIDASGIYTGTLSASTVNALRINATQITAGIIDAARINVDALKASLITAGNIDALTLTVIKGKIGGWSIGVDTITIGTIGTVGAIPLQIRSISTGYSSWYNGTYKPYGLSILWYQNSNAGHIVFGQIAASGSSVKTGFIGIQMMAWDNTEYFCLSTNYTKSGAKEVYNRIAGWAFDHASIWKNNVSLSADGTIFNGIKWKLANDGSGSLAGGNITWDSVGNVSFGASVKLNWTIVANDALNTAIAYTDTKKNEAIITASTDATNKSYEAKELAMAMAYGRMLYRDPTFSQGGNSMYLYNNAGNGTVSLTRIADTTAPNDTKQVILIKNTGYASPNCGGFNFGTGTSNKKIFITRIIAKIPLGRSIEWATNSIGTGGFQKWLTSTAGTGDWSEYVCKVSCGTSNFSNTNFFTITGAAGTPAAPVEWRVAYATVFDVTSNEGSTTTIDANGIYTGTLTAAQVNAVSIDAGSIKSGLIIADRIAAGSITSTKLDATSIRANIINTDYINGLSCTFLRGKIGGWTIGSDNIGIGNIGWTGEAPIQIRSNSTGSGYWYLGSYRPMGLSVLWYQNSNAGHIVFGQIASSGSTVKTGFVGIQMMAWDNTEYFCLSANYSISGGKDVYNRIAGWAFDNTRIWKNNVSLGVDGSIQNGTKWQVNNDGSGRLAGGNIAWDANGDVSFADSVSLSWRKYATYIDVNGIYTGSISAGQIKVDTTLVVGGSTYNGNISVRDASNSIKVTLNRDGIIAVGGVIGGWSISSSQISKNNVVLGSDGSITNGTKWKLNTDGSGFVAGGNVSWTTTGAVTITGTINATSGKIGDFEIGYGRIGSAINDLNTGGSLSILRDLIRVGSDSSYVLIGSDTFPASLGGAFVSTGKFVNNKNGLNEFFSTNCGIFLDVQNAKKNYGIYSNACLLAPQMISTRIKTIYFTGSGYEIDFSQNNLFFIYASSNYTVTLPTESSVCNMFGYSYLPSDFACVFTMVYNYNWSNNITFTNIKNFNGVNASFGLTRGDSITIMCSKYPDFHYQVMNYHT